MPPKVGEFKLVIYTRSTGLIKARFEKIKTTVTELARQDEPISQVQARQLAGFTTEIRKKRSEFELNLQRALSLDGS